MNYLKLTLAWLSTALFLLVALSLSLLHNWFEALLFLFGALLLFPPLGTILRRELRWKLRLGTRLFLVASVSGAALISVTMEAPISPYTSGRERGRLMRIYDSKLKQWPVEYEERFVQTSFGSVHLIVSGPPQAPPMLLLHGTGTAGWIWQPNIAALSEHYRTYVVDLPGEGGKSEYFDLRRRMQEGRDHARHYHELTRALGIEEAVLMAASLGAVQAGNYALHHPERVRALVLLAPMGFTGPLCPMLRVTSAQLFPLDPIRRATFDWLYGESARIEDELAEWFLLAISSARPIRVPPVPLSPAERRDVQVPVLFVFGEYDKALGDPRKAVAEVEHVPYGETRIVESGHLPAMEMPEAINTLVLQFLARHR